MAPMDRRPARARTACVLGALALTAAGCGAATPELAAQAPAGSAAPATAATQPSAGPATAGTGASLPQGGEPVELDPTTFTADVDHPYWPMRPGTRWTYREVDQEGTVVDVVMTVLDQTRVVANGVTGRVVRDTVRRDGSIIEDTLDWYAQDADGNVWYLGEETAEFRDGEVTSREGAWEAGVAGAQPGVLLPAAPAEGMRYRQEYLAGVAEDEGEVLRVGELVQVEAGAYEDALVTRDTVPLEPDVVEYKFYVRDVGPVLALDVSGGVGREELVAVDRAPPGFGTGPLGDP